MTPQFYRMMLSRRWWSLVAALAWVLPLGAEEAKPAPPTLSASEVVSLFKGTEGAFYSDWGTLGADSEAWSKHVKSGHVSIRNEGRIHEGGDQYRKAFKKRPEGLAFWCRTGESEATHFKSDLARRKAGYVLVWLQAFRDTAGESRFQAVWVKVAGPPTDAAG